MSTILMPSNPHSLLCKLRIHSLDIILHTNLTIGGIDMENTFATRWCRRCGELKELKRNSKVWIIQIGEISPEHWKKLDELKKEGDE